MGPRWVELFAKTQHEVRLAVCLFYPHVSWPVESLSSHFQLGQART